MTGNAPVQHWYAAAISHHQAGRIAEAQALYQQILQHDPNHPDALHMLGVAHHQLGDHASAEQFIRQAIAMNSRSPMYLGNLASALSAQQKYVEAIESLRHAIQLNPTLPIVHYNLGVALLRLGQLEAAIDAFQNAINLRPDYPEAHNNLGNAFRAAGRLPEALNAHRQALSPRPTYAEARLNVGLVLLLQGHLAEGWPYYEARWEVNRHLPQRRFNQPLWDGSPLTGRRILLHAEQGLGDTIQMIRFGPLVAARGGRVIVECQPPLKRLLSNMPQVEQVVAQGNALAAFDVHCPIMSLPRVFGTTLQTIPAQTPYLHADPELTETWKQRVPPMLGILNVGLVWAGRPVPPGRSIPAAMLGAFKDLPHVRFHSLQVRQDLEPAPSSPPDLELVDHSPSLHDLAETAALLSHLDLLITIDTAAAHLGGAMGKPTWVLLPFSPDWRWMLDRTDSPWYPTMRLFRQSAPGRWEQPLAEVRQALCALADKPHSE